MVCMLKTDGPLAESAFVRKFVLKTRNSRADANEDSVTR